ncbi:MAG: hypothetical protein JXM70_14725 [Pirellulales bacterium]|nr:hypothetical protein [Pirellulales bacterium]
MPAILQKLARHAHISTTMSFYVSLAADEIGADLWSEHKKKADNNPAIGNTAHN